MTILFHYPSGQSIRSCREKNDGHNRGKAKEDPVIMWRKQKLDQNAARKELWLEEK
jgi:hypothetical protein